MKYKLNPKNPREVLDELGNKFLYFTGDYMQDLFALLKRLNGYDI